MTWTELDNRHKETGNGMEKLLSVKEAADLCSCSEAAIWKWVYQRRLPAVKVGRLTRLRQSDLEAFVSRR